MGKMKEVYQLKQELVMKDHWLKDMPDSYFIELYLQEKEYYESGADQSEETEDCNDIQENKE